MSKFEMLLENLSNPNQERLDESKKSKCVYCGSTSYGRGCRYSPTGIHLHPTTDKCVYCGSKSLGRGCRYAPDKLHIRFSSTGLIQAEKYAGGLISGYVMKRMMEPITESECYKLGLVNERGHLVRKPETIEEKEAYSGVERFLLKLKRHFRESLNMLDSSILFEDIIEQNKELDMDQLQNEHNFKEDIDCLSDSFYNLVEEYKGKLTQEQMERIIFEGFSRSK